MRGLWSVLVLALAGTAAASPVVLTVNPAASNLDVTLCMTITGTRCDTDSSPVAGTVTVSLDCLTNPTTMTLYDFHYILTQSIDLRLNWGTFVGQFNATATDVNLLYGPPNTPMPPTPLGAGGAYALSGVPDHATGTLNYNATLLVCVALTGAGYACNASIDLSTLTLNPVDMTGTITVAGRTMTMVTNVNVSGPLDPANPGLGTLTLAGTIVANGVVPLPDVATLAAVLVGDITDLDLVCECDVDGDGVTDARDIKAYVQALLGP